MQKWLLFSCVLVFSLLAATGQAWAQKISGKVTDEKTGQPIEGVTVAVKGNRSVSATNANGDFQVTAKVGDILDFTYVGYGTVQQKLTGTAALSIKMQNRAGDLNDVVVVGYGKQKKMDVISSISVVKGEDLTRLQTPSGYLALEGQVPGLNIRNTGGDPGGGDAYIRIRGEGSLSMGSSPYVVIDGSPADPSDLQTLDMSTIESISVLKDAAASSIYGLRAANGVILITTKRGANEGGKMRLSYNAYATYQTPTKMPDPVSAIDYMRYMDTAAVNNSQTTLPYTAQQISDYTTLGVDNYDRYNTDWKNIIIAQGAWMQNHSIALSGGTDKLRSAVSGSYFDQDGLVANNHFTRYTFRANNDYTVNKWARVTLDADYLQTSTLAPYISTPTSIINKALTFVPIKDGINNDGTWGYPNGVDNPIADARASGTIKGVQQVLTASGGLILTPVKGLTSTTDYTIRTSTGRSTSIDLPYRMYYQGLDKGTNTNDTSVAESWNQYTMKTLRTQLDYHIKVARHHNFAILGGTQYEVDKTQSLGGTKTGYPFAPNYMVLNDGNAASATNNGSYSQLDLVSFFERFDYNYDEKYFVEANVRQDALSALAPGHQWGNFPSVSAGWRISEERFFQPLKKYVNELKLRGSRGVLGNAQFPTAFGISSYYAASNVVVPGYSYPFDKSIVTGAEQTTVANAMITWESTRVTDGGLDAEFLKGKVNLTFDYYDKYTYNLLTQAPIPGFVGMENGYLNAGSMENRGWELGIGYRQKIGNVHLVVNANISDNRNKVLSFVGASQVYGSQRIGYPYSSYFGYKTAGLFQNQHDINNWPSQFGADANDRSNEKPGYVKYVDVNGDGKVDANDQVYLGSPFDVHFPYNADIRVEWKGFDVDADLQGTGQRVYYISGTGITPFSVGTTIFQNELNTWSPSNPNAKNPILLPDGVGGNNWLLSDRSMGNAAYLRLKLLTLGYSLPKKWTDDLKMGPVRFYVAFQNLVTFSKFYPGFDPEISASGTAFYPIMKTTSFGINANF